MTPPTSKPNRPIWHPFPAAAVEVQDLGFATWGLAVGLGLELARPLEKPLLSTRLTGRSFAQRVIVGPALARVTWLTARLDGCAFNVALRRIVYARPCVAFEGGVVHATAEGIASPRDVHRPWLALGPFLELEAPILGPVRADVDLGLLFPLVQTQLVFDPGVPVERRMVVVPWGSLGFGFHFL
jgi:hypothetical protein